MIAVLVCLVIALLAAGVVLTLVSLPELRASLARQGDQAHPFTRWTVERADQVQLRLHALRAEMGRSFAQGRRRQAEAEAERRREHVSH